MKVAVVGGGPAGLYVALLLKQARPDADITVLERNRRDDTFGWGVVFSDQTMVNFRAADADSFARITAALAHWDDIDVHVRDRVITSSGHGFSGIARKKLLEILQGRCEELGRHAALPDRGPRRGRAGPARAGGRRRHRRRRRRQQRLAGRSRRAVRARSRRPHGEVHLARHQPAARRLHLLLRRERARRVPGALLPLRRRHLDLHRRVRRGVVAPRRLRPPRPAADGRGLRGALRAGGSTGTGSGRTRRRRRRRGPASCACATAPGSTSGSSSSAMPRTPRTSRSARAPSWRWRTPSRWRGCWPARSRWPRRSPSTRQERMTEALRLQNAARNSMEWFEHVERYIRLDPEQFAYSLLTRSQRVSHENLRLRDRGYLEGVERWFAPGAPRGRRCRRRCRCSRRSRCAA